MHTRTVLYLSFSIALEFF